MPDLEIPESALAHKPWFEEQPSPAVVSEIKAFIKETGCPHLWHGHTHTRPPAATASIRYLGKYDLPASHAGQRNRTKWAPCPCCHWKSPWYFRDGRIAWFPEEKVIRNIGRHCYKSIDAAGDAEAERLLNIEENRRRTEAYLVGHLPLVPQMLAVISANSAIIDDIDRVRFILSKRIRPAIDFDLWHHVRADGALKITITRIEQRVDTSGNQTEHRFDDFQRYGPIDGYEMLDPAAKPMAERIARLAQKLSTIDFGDQCANRLAALTDAERTKAVQALRSAASINEIFAEAETVRRFLSPLSLGSLNGWSRQQGAPASIYIALSDDRSQLFLGKNEDDARPLIFKPMFFNTLRKLPAVSRSINEIE
jgi:hypothetical protein